MTMTKDDVTRIHERIDALRDDISELTAIVKGMVAEHVLCREQVDRHDKGLHGNNGQGVKSRLTAAETTLLSHTKRFDASNRDKRTMAVQAVQFVLAVVLAVIVARVFPSATAVPPEGQAHSESVVANGEG